MEILQEDLQRAFIHEIGHFIAGEINYQAFNCNIKAKSITLFQREHTNFVDGEMIPLEPYNDLYITNEYVQSFYGCLFEALYRDINLCECLCVPKNEDEHLKNNFCNGYHDDRLMNTLQAKAIGSFKTWKNYLFDDYFNLMKAQKNHFENILNINVNDYILNVKEFTYIIDLEKLSNTTKNFVKSHTPYYIELIKKLNFFIQNK